MVDVITGYFGNCDWSELKENLGEISLEFGFILNYHSLVILRFENCLLSMAICDIYRIIYCADPWIFVDYIFRVWKCRNT